eukprot:scaffold32001_cov53-Phaeocystis_antarctica.AAC.2
MSESFSTPQLPSTASPSSRLLCGGAALDGVNQPKPCSSLSVGCGFKILTAVLICEPTLPRRRVSSEGGRGARPVGGGRPTSGALDGRGAGRGAF